MSESASKLEVEIAKILFSTRSRERIYKKLIKFISSGISLVGALEIIFKHYSNDYKNPKDVKAIPLSAWINNLKEGKTFADSIKGWVPENDRIVIEAGETSGDLALGIKNVLFINDGQKKIKKAILSGLAYPSLLIISAVVFLIVFGIEVIPVFEKVLPREYWSGPPAKLALVSDIIRHWGYYIVSFFIILIAAVIYLMPKWSGVLRTYFDKLPPWSIYRLWVGSGFLLSISAMIKAGVTDEKALMVLRNGASNWYYERLTKTLGFLREGNNFGDSLYMTGYDFPDKETVQDLRAYASLSSFAEILENIGHQWLEESIEKINVQMSIFKNFALIFMAIMFAWLATSLFALQQQVSNGGL